MLARSVGGVLLELLKLLESEDESVLAVMRFTAIVN
jgi:hypothetical protein